MEEKEINCKDYVKGPLCYACGVYTCIKKKCKNKKECPLFYTIEHIPPRAIFEQLKKVSTSLRNPNKDEITTTACSKCNNEYSKYDQIFVTYTALIAANLRPDILELALYNIKNNFSKDRKTFNAIKNSFIASNVNNSKISIIAPPREHYFALKKVLIKIARGFYYKHTSQILEQELKYIIDNSRIQKDSIFSNLDIHNAINDLFTSEYMCENGIKQISKNIQNRVFSYAIIENLKAKDGEAKVMFIFKFYDAWEVVLF